MQQLGDTTPTRSWALLLFLAPICALAQSEQALTLSSGYTSISGNSDAYSARTHREEGLYVAIDQFRMIDQIGDSGQIALQLSANPSWEDYQLSLQIKQPQWGSLSFEYDTYKVGYLGVGSLLTETSELYQSSPPLLWVNREHFQITGVFQRGDLPILRIHYSRRERSGSKNSTVWAANNDNRIGQDPKRGIVPSLRGLNELHESLEVSLEKSLPKTQVAIAYRVDSSEIDNYHLIDQFAGDPDENQKITETQQAQSTSTTLRGVINHTLSSQLKFTASASAHSTNSSQAGGRIYGDAFFAPYDPLAEVRNQGDIGYRNLEVDADITQFITNANLAYKPSNDLTFILSGRLEKIRRESFNTFLETDWLRDPATFIFTGGETLVEGSAENDFDELSLRLETRYRGLKHLSLYLRGSAYYGTGFITELSNRTDLIPAPSPTELWVDRENDFTRKGSRIVTGFSWYPQRKLTVSAQFRHERKTNEYTPTSTYRAPRERLKYPNYLKQHDWVQNQGSLNFRWAPLKKITLSTRISASSRDQETESVEDPAINSGRSYSFSISESVSWSVHPKVTVQAFVSYTEQELTTPTNELLAPQVDLVTKSYHPYFYGSIESTWQINEHARLEAHYSHLQSGDYRDTSFVSVSYDQQIRENIVELVYYRQVSEHFSWNLGVSFHESNDFSTDGFNTFEATSIILGMRREY